MFVVLLCIWLLNNKSSRGPDLESGVCVSALPPGGEALLLLLGPAGASVSTRLYSCRSSVCSSWVTLLWAWYLLSEACSSALQRHEKKRRKEGGRVLEQRRTGVWCKKIKRPGGWFHKHTRAVFISLHWFRQSEALIYQHPSDSSHLKVMTSHLAQTLTSLDILHLQGTSSALRWGAPSWRGGSPARLLSAAPPPAFALGAPDSAWASPLPSPETSAASEPPVVGIGGNTWKDEEFGLRASRTHFLPSYLHITGSCVQ